MKAYKVEILIIDHDELGVKGIVETIENARYPNRCISPEVKGIKWAKIGEWSDDHPLNKIDEAENYYAKLFI